MSGCRHLNGRRCMMGLCGGLPDAACCSTCPQYDGPARGLGDVVHAVTRYTGIAAVVGAVAGPDCGCAERRRRLNESVPFGTQGA